MPLPAELVNRVRSANALVVLSGAGLSADSGLATFRGTARSLWHNRRPEELATPAALANDPELVWRWHRERRRLALAATPNRAHAAIVELAAMVNRCVTITQNVDGLLQRAGATDVIEFHGNLFLDRCSRTNSECVPERAEPTAAVPHCTQCGAALRPGVVWFGEMIDSAVLEHAVAACDSTDGVLVVGTSATVAPANALASVARRAGAWIAEINPAETTISRSVDHVLRGQAGDILPAIADLLDA
ncbi:MAG: NAD-dependent deacylase [Pseudomonadota bacterium]